MKQSFLLIPSLYQRDVALEGDPFLDNTGGWENIS
jgi:hypothetical protein